MKSTAPPPFASGCSADGSILRGDRSFESGVIPTGMTGGVLQTETVDGVPNKYYKVANRVSPNHGVYIEMDAGCALPGRRYRFSARHRLDNGAMDDEFLGSVSYQKPGQDWVHKHFMDVSL